MSPPAFLIRLAAWLCAGVLAAGLGWCVAIVARG